MFCVRLEVRFRLSDSFWRRHQVGVFGHHHAIAPLCCVLYDFFPYCSISGIADLIGLSLVRQQSVCVYVLIYSYSVYAAVRNKKKSQIIRNRINVQSHVRVTTTTTTRRRRSAPSTESPRLLYMPPPRAVQQNASRRGDDNDDTKRHC